jgi:hypothetical protein
METKQLQTMLARFLKDGTVTEDDLQQVAALLESLLRNLSSVQQQCVKDSDEFKMANPYHILREILLEFFGNVAVLSHEIVDATDAKEPNVKFDPLSITLALLPNRHLVKTKGQNADLQVLLSGLIKELLPLTSASVQRQCQEQAHELIRRAEVSAKIMQILLESFGTALEQQELLDIVTRMIAKKRFKQASDFVTRFKLQRNMDCHEFLGPLIATAQLDAVSAFLNASPQHARWVIEQMGEHSINPTSAVKLIARFKLDLDSFPRIVYLKKKEAIRWLVRLNKAEDFTEVLTENSPDLQRYQCRQLWRRVESHPWDEAAIARFFRSCRMFGMDLDPEFEEKMLTKPTAKIAHHPCKKSYKERAREAKAKKGVSGYDASMPVLCMPPANLLFVHDLATLSVARRILTAPDVNIIGLDLEHLPEGLIGLHRYPVFCQTLQVATHTHAFVFDLQKLFTPQAEKKIIAPRPTSDVAAFASPSIYAPQKIEMKYLTPSPLVALNTASVEDLKELADVSLGTVAETGSANASSTTAPVFVDLDILSDDDDEIEDWEDEESDNEDEEAQAAEVDDFAERSDDDELFELNTGPIEYTLGPQSLPASPAPTSFPAGVDDLLQVLFNNPDIIKIGTAFDVDLSKLRRDFPLMASFQMPLYSYVDCVQLLKKLPDHAPLLYKRDETQMTFLSLDSLDNVPSGDDTKAQPSTLPELAADTETKFVPPPVYTKERIAQPVSNAKKEGGLARLVRLVLGTTLDKQEQISNWALRPLRDNQLHYAGLDALCQVLVLMHLRHRVEQNNSTFIINQLNL